MTEENMLGERCTVYLLKIGITANLQGFRYLREAILSIVKEPKLKRGVTKFLYPQLAKKHNVSVPVVERAMRHAIDFSYKNKGMIALNKIISYTICDSGYKPSISELTSLLAEKLIADLNKMRMEKLIAT